MSDTFQPGEMVRLKSGGPTMTVVHEQSPGRLFCQWFTAAKELKDDFFDGHLLLRVTPAERDLTNLPPR